MAKPDLKTGCELRAGWPGWPGCIQMPERRRTLPVSLWSCPTLVPLPIKKTHLEMKKKKKSIDLSRVALIP